VGVKVGQDGDKGFRLVANGVQGQGELGPYAVVAPKGDQEQLQAGQLLTVTGLLSYCRGPGGRAAAFWGGRKKTRRLTAGSQESAILGVRSSHGVQGILGTDVIKLLNTVVVTLECVAYSCTARRSNALYKSDFPKNSVWNFLHSFLSSG
jgi:hypothetical protein